MKGLVDKVTSVVSKNLQVEKLTVLDSGGGNGLPNYVKNVTNSALVILEQLKTATGLDVPGLLQSAAEGTNNSTRIPRELPVDRT